MNIPILYYETLHSTSELAKKLVADEKRSLPFALVAREQTGGKGRQGSKWESPAGNLYITLAFSAEQLLLPSLSLQVAAFFAQWIEDLFHVRVSIKWPNDILFAGKKLAGILCETLYVGQDPKHTFIGIGLNVLQAPFLSGADYQSIALKDFCSNFTLRDTPEFLAESLVSFFEKNFRRMKEENSLNTLYDSYSFGPGQLLLKTASDNKKEAFLEQGIDAKTGHLQVYSLKSRSSHQVTSSHHDFVWAYQKSLDHSQIAPLVVADIGNSWIKLGLWKEVQGKVCFIEKISHKKPSLFFKTLQNLRNECSLPGQNWPLYIGSVRKNEKFLENCKSTNFFPVEIRKKRILSWGSYPVSQLGIDRLAFMEGCLGRHREFGMAPALYVLVSFGTATTVDVLKSSGEHLGGVILPGLETSLDALYQKTYLLPKLGAFLKEEKFFLGQSTEEAMIYGVFGMQINFLKGVVRELMEKFGYAEESFVQILTGGLASTVRPFIPKSQIEDDLILDGMRRLILGG